MVPRVAILVCFLVTLSVPGTAQRLPDTVVPNHYDLHFVVDLERARFDGTETIHVRIDRPTRSVVLNAVEVSFQEVSISHGSSTETAVVSLNEREQTATFTVAQPLAPGPAEIRVRYTGVLNDKLRGFYLSQDERRRYAVTQFESTDARRAFPCFDEPAFKATFAVSVVVNRGDTAISNGKIVSDTSGPTRTQHTIAFATSPKMSTYLVALAVGPFRCLEGGADGIPIRICATPEKKDLGRVALDLAQQILKFYHGYFAVKYPFGKLDVVAVPDFAAGAMENTAAIFYRETDLLADGKAASVAVRKNIASVLAHEMAHQWFGNLVTMRWWDDIWLNEGFATWMANRPLAAMRPDWNIAVDEALETQTALNLDGLQATRPIHARVETPGEIEEAFDQIAYEKGAAVLRMIESYVGVDTFRRGVNAYLQAHAYGNATSEDFWSAIAATSGKPIDRILPTFVNQPGAPLVSVSTACAGGRADVTLSQERFFVDPALLEAGSPERWQVPVCLKTDRSDVTCDLLGEPRHVSSLGAGGCGAWVFANAGARGYYRTAYPPDILRAIAPRVEDILSAPERLSLANDEWELVRAGRHAVADYLTLAAGFGREHTSGVLAIIAERLAFVREYLTSGGGRARFEAFTRSLLRPLVDELGFASAATDSDDRRALRSTVIAALGTTGADAGIAAQARTALDRALRGGPPLDPTTAGAIVSVAAEHGDGVLFESLMAAADRATSPEEHYRYLYAIPAFRDPILVDRALQFSLSPKLRSQDAALYLGRFFANDEARPRAWSFLKAHWTELEPKITIALGDVNLVRSLAAFCDTETRDDIRRFFGTHKLPAVARTLDQTIERIDSCIALREKQTSGVERWLTTATPTLQP